MKVEPLAKYTLKKFEHKPIAPLKLQRLLFYTKVWGIVTGVNLIEEGFEKWDYGPVNPKIYHTYKEYGKNPISAPGSFESVPSPIEKEKALIDFILEAYMPYSALSLSSMTHEEDPWKVTPTGEIIDAQVIKEYYSKQPFAENFKPFTPDHSPYYPVQSDLWHSFVMDMDEDDAARDFVYDSFETFKKELNKATKETQEMLRTWLNK